MKKPVLFCMGVSWLCAGVWAVLVALGPVNRAGAVLIVAAALLNILTILIALGRS